MGKRKWHFERIAEFKERFRDLSTEQIQQRLNTGMLQKEAAIALRELLEERVVRAPRESLPEILTISHTRSVAEVIRPDR